MVLLKRGATAWQHLNFSSLAVKDLRFGHFNPKELKKADIFAIVDGQWSVSFGGTSKWEKLNDKIWDNISDLVFGDFNGDGVTDIATDFGATAKQMAQLEQQMELHPADPPPPPQPITWYVSWSGRGPWVVLNTWTSWLLDCSAAAEYAHRPIRRQTGYQHYWSDEIDR